MQTCRTLLNQVIVLLTWFVLQLAPGDCRAQDSFPFDKQIEAHVQPYLDANKFRGISIGVVLKDQIRFYNFGKVAEEGDQPTNQTLYEIGSISKVFTSVLLADAVVQQQLKLDTTIGSLVDGLEKTSPDIAAIYLQQLSNHVSGLPRLPGNWSPTNPNDPYADYDRERLLTYLGDTVLLHEPSTHHQYSNLGVGLLGELITMQSNKPYADLLQARIAGPLQMNDTCIDVPESKLSRFSQPHFANLDVGHRWHFQALTGAGGIRSTTADMVKFIQANLDPPDNELGQALDLAFEKHLDATSKHRAMGLGWMIAGDGTTRWHNGQTGGYQSMMLVSRKLNAGVVLLSNTAGGGTDQLAENIFQTIVGMDVPPRKF